ncbi:Crp/Fnr family transcriptional regulator [Pelosinus baikalensis]|uniref:Crp/Fnr family transcriptional regulator n=1 Tax=Pelosinus baikalensis TaxID=2892015 RepID=A0ABS8HNF3_9FIRM|nr:Crp/Fnr family transcriptional regulator [Pelosinus baikalensis]MCC5464691.1 Crp/Fnr family transcriptional regulator [Pelosinus baikalensis]
MDANIVKILVSSPIFHDISPSQLDIMLDCLNPKINTYNKNSYIAVQGEPYTGLGILLLGEAAIIKESASGSRVIMTVIGPGDLFGEMIAFSPRKHWPASVFAQGTCSVMFLPPEKIIGECTQVCGGYKQLIKNMLVLLSTKALMLNQRVEYLAIKGMREKISIYLLEQYKINQKNTFVLPLKRNELADFLSVSRTALSRELGRMRDEGIIEFYRTSVKINNLAMLRRGAE